MCASFGVPASAAKTEAMCLMTKRVDGVTFVAETADQFYKQTAKLCTVGQLLCARMLTLLSRSTGACYWRTYVSEGMACHCETCPPRRFGSKYGRSKPRSWKPCCTVVPRGAPPLPISPCCTRLTTDCSNTASDGRKKVGMVTTCYLPQTLSPRVPLRTSRLRCENR